MRRAPTSTQLAPPRVDPSKYDEDYYLTKSAGSEPWSESGGAELHPMYEGMFTMFPFETGGVVVDVGTGRGEFPVVAVRHGASVAIGIEYSESALQLARRTVAAAGADGRILLSAADARALPLPDGTIDLVTMLDVVEHLAPDELDLALREAHRVLRPGGRLFAHTFPTSTIYDLTYRWQRRAVPGRAKRWPANPRNDYELTMHVNEQTRRSLGSALRWAGFADVSVTYGRWVYDAFVPEIKAKRLYHRLARTPLKGLGIADLWAHAIR